MKKNQNIEKNIDNQRSGVSVADFFYPQIAPEETQTIDKSTDGVYRRFLHVVFDNVISPNQINQFRGGFINAVGKEHAIFHNHSPNGYIYKYPLVQYKIYKKNLPSILCIEQGVDEIYHFFNKKDWTIDIQGTKHRLNVDQLNLYDAFFRVITTQKQYKIFNWLALSQHNYYEYILARSLKQKITQLEKILIGNILSMAKGLDWFIDKKITLEIDNIDKINLIKFKNNTLMAFDVTFHANVILPNNIGLGKGVSNGFGVLRKITQKS